MSRSKQTSTGRGGEVKGNRSQVGAPAVVHSHAPRPFRPSKPLLAVTSFLLLGWLVFLTLLALLAQK